MKGMNSVAGWLFLLATGGAWHALGAAPDRDRFRKHVIDPDFPAISAVAADLDGNGRLDVIAAGGPSGGPSPWSNLVYAYRAPDWKRSLVCRLEEKAILLHIDRVQSARRADDPTAPGAPVEIVLTDGALNEIWWYRHDREADTWDGHRIVSGYIGAHGTASGDLDGDGYDDIVVPTQLGEPKRGMLWARNPGPNGLAAGTPWETVPLAESFTVSGWREYVRLADLNGNGRLDVLHRHLWIRVEDGRHLF